MYKLRNEGTLLPDSVTYTLSPPRAAHCLPFTLRVMLSHVRVVGIAYSSCPGPYKRLLSKSW